AFYAYDPAFSGGVYVAAGAIDAAGNGGAELVTGAGPGGGPHVKIFTDSNSNGTVSDNPLFDQFFAYAPGFNGGVRVAVGDTDNSGFFSEVITAPGPTGGPHIRIFDDTGDPGVLLSDNAVSDEFFAYSATYSAGVFPAFGKVKSETFSFSTFPQAIPDLS